MKNNHLQSKNKMHVAFLVLIKKLSALLGEINYKIQIQDLMDLSKVLKINSIDFQKEINLMGIIDIRRIVMECGIDYNVIDKINKKMPYIVPNYNSSVIEEKLEIFKMVTTYIALSKVSYKKSYANNLNNVKNNNFKVEINIDNLMSYKYIMHTFMKSNLSVENFCIIAQNDSQVDIKKLTGLDILTPAYFIKMVQVYNAYISDENSKVQLQSNINLNEDYVVIEKSCIKYSGDSQTNAKWDYLYNGGLKLVQIYNEERKKANIKSCGSNAYQIIDYYEILNPIISGRNEGYSYLERNFHHNDTVDVKSLKLRIEDCHKKMETSV